MAAEETGEQGQPSQRNNNYYNVAKSQLDQLVQEWNEEGYKKAKVSPPKLAAKAGINYNTWHKNGVTQQLQAEISCITYKPWIGFKINIEKYIENELENND